tara:strand:+ start:1534 stop:1761 length:228 start_codon:yes stop_codon:yes gene_type:complete
MADSLKNKISEDFIIHNFDIGQLSDQKHRHEDCKQIPFFFGVGISHRSRGIPYLVSTNDKPDVYFPYSKPHSIVD